MVEIIRIPALSDNYIWMMHDADSGETVIVDPAEAQPVLDEAERRGWAITQIWNTHWHPDHVGGNAAIKAATDCTVTGPAGEVAKIETLDRTVSEGDVVTIGSHEARVIDVPAHTAGHIAYYLADVEIGDTPDASGAAFVGDTLFAMGCGRLFEGSAQQMYDAMRKLEALPDSTNVYCAHEYTVANGKYALVAEPDNQAIVARMERVRDMRARDEATVPFMLVEERETNPFMRADSVDELARRRKAKDNF